MGNKITKTISYNVDDFDFLKMKGINRSEFMRQAITAYKNNLWNYDRAKQQ